MDSNDRRKDPRVNVCMPLQFRALNQPGSIGKTAQSVNLSQSGICFVTDVPLKIGALLEVSLRVPHKIAGTLSSEVMCVGRVVHVHPDALQAGMSGIGMHIERFEAKLPERDRFAN